MLLDKCLSFLSKEHGDVASTLSSSPKLLLHKLVPSDLNEEFSTTNSLSRKSLLNCRQELEKSVQQNQSGEHVFYSVLSNLLYIILMLHLVLYDGLVPAIY